MFRDRISRLAPCVLAALVLQAGATPVSAAELAPLQALARSTPPAPRLAGLFDLKLVLAEERDLATLLRETGIAPQDADTAAGEALAHASGDAGPCGVKVSLLRSARGGELSLQRLVVMTASGQTVIERRGGLLTVVPNDAVRPRPAPLT